MKRMTAEEVVGLFADNGEEHGESWNQAAMIVDTQLVPRWQPEPTEEGEYHVFGIARACWVYREECEGEPWAIEHVVTDFGTGIDSLRLEPLNGRQVCPIGARPQ